MDDISATMSITGYINKLEKGNTEKFIPSLQDG
jgi:hypothetical protein